MKFNYIIPFIIAANSASVLLTNYQNGRYFADSISLINNTQSPVTFFTRRATGTININQQEAVTLKTTSFIHDNFMYTIDCAQPDLTQPIGKILNHATLDIATLCFLAHRFNKNQEGLDELVLNNDTYYQIELIDLNENNNQVPITLKPGELFPKNAGYNTSNKREEAVKIGQISLDRFGEKVLVTYPRRIYKEGVAHTMDFRSVTLNLSTLFECKKYDISITAKPLTAALLAKLLKK